MTLPTSKSSLSQDNHNHSTHPDFSSSPTIFVLPTHLDLEELHSIEENLLECGATMTYNIAEARLVLGKVGQEKRAAFELRARGVWTEEVGERDEPPLKRRRVGEMEARREPKVVDLSTESEGEEDGMEGHTGKDSKPTQAYEGKDVIKVIKLSWFEKSIKAGELLPIDPFVIYQARKINPPKDATKPNGGQVLQRAKQDAAFKPPAPPASHRREVHDSQHKPPKLYRQTTSEHDEAVPLPPAPDWVKNNILYACMRSAPLHSPNEDFITQLVKIRTIRELTLDEIGVRAYSTSIASIAAYPYKIRRPSEILSLPGCESKIANLFSEFEHSNNGTLSAAETLHTDPDLKILHEFYKIWGVGAKTAREFFYTKQWRDINDIIDHGWNNISRVQQIGVKYYDEFLEGIPRSEVEDITQTITRHANLVRPKASYDGRGVECIIVGGYRRGKQICGDVDIVLSHRDETVTKDLVVDIVGSLESEGWITHTLVLNLSTSHRDQQPLPFHGDDSGKHFDSLDKALVVWQNPHFPKETQSPSSRNRTHRNRNPNPHRRVDIIISPWRTVGCAVLGWSGDTTFERDLRRYAKKARGWKFDSSGVRERTGGGRVIDLEVGGETWEERERLVMERLGVGWRAAEERCTR